MDNKNRFFIFSDAYKDTSSFLCMGLLFKFFYLILFVAYKQKKKNFFTFSKKKVRTLFILLPNLTAILRNMKSQLIRRHPFCTFRTVNFSLPSIISHSYLSHLQDEDFVKSCQKTYQKDGYLHLASFITDECAKYMIKEALHLESNPKSFNSYEQHNIWLEEESPESKTWESLNSSKKLIAADIIEERYQDKGKFEKALTVGPCQQLYEYAIFRSFISKVLLLGHDDLYVSGDKQGKYYYNIFQPKNELGWHFDRSEFSVNLILQPSTSGGHFQFIPHSRKVFENEKKSVQQKSVADVIRKHHLQGQIRCESDLKQGSLYLFNGNQSLHCVTPVQSGKRINLIFTFNTKPNQVLNEYTLLKFFGRKD
ncbi:hypothetical protein RFI_27266 [Reticulomyxa filosa]|uniref:Fe2OG dioxygenase domain-containing protein n=1 Tax=Reticulomyxa filosa TaxID=46433 RepID=X6M9F6_RETFI|nr:hypothetical protein RFI_27266 [Reticulomyxa filosa]|eukprot:ETO10112.1 hypothetical protein RFI_27266 [Reticulomyxa filosa]